MYNSDLLASYNEGKVEDALTTPHYHIISRQPMHTSMNNHYSSTSYAILLQSPVRS
jgi:hypothetical protein